jgi:hypothetical protein
MLVQKICQIPDDLFYYAAEEIDNIEWSEVQDPRSKTSVFSTSKAIHLRVHRPPENKPWPNTVEGWSAIVETIDNPYQINNFPKIMSLVNWVYEKVSGVRLGRVMIIKVESGGNVNLHIDPLQYFEVHSRFHIPFKTNINVIFHSGNKDEGEHMPYKTLCRLNNRIEHAMSNNGSEDRIHLLIDVETPSGNEIF